MHDLTIQATTQQQTFSIAELRELSSEFSKCGLFAVKSPEQAFALMMLCQSEGIHAVQAMKRYHLIEDRNGKVTPSMRADAMQSDFQSKGGKVEWIRTDDEECAAKFSHPIHQPTPLEIRRTFKRYADNGIAIGWKDGKSFVKDNWKKSPDAMLRARVISAGVRAVLPGVVTGIYTPEEVRDFEEDQIPKTVTTSAPSAPRSQSAPAVKEDSKPATAAPVVQGTAKQAAPAPKAEVAEFTPVETSPAARAPEQEVTTAPQAEPTQDATPSTAPEATPPQVKTAIANPLAYEPIPDDVNAQRALFAKLGLEIHKVNSELCQALKFDWKASTCDAHRRAVLGKAQDELR